MGSAVGQVPDYTCMITEWVKEVATIPVMVKLTPNVGDVAAIGRAAVRGGADAISLINTINSIMGVDLDTLAPKPAVRGYGSHGGYCGPAVKPIALNMVAAVAADPAIKVPISGIGGIQAWQDAVEFLLLGAELGAGLHGRHALRIPDRRAPDERPRRLDAREGLPVDRATSSAARCRGSSRGASST